MSLLSLSYRLDKLLIVVVNIGCIPVTIVRRRFFLAIIFSFSDTQQKFQILHL